MSGLSTATGLENVLSSIVQGAAHLCRAHMVSINLLAEGADALDVGCVYGARGPVHPTRLPIDESLSGAVIRSGRAFRCRDVRALRRDARTAFARANDVRGVFILPLRRADGLLGTLAVARTTPWRYTSHEERLLSLLADAASVAIQMARQRAEQPAPPSGDGRLGRQEREIARLLIADKTYKEIAQTLHLSDRTVGHYVERLKLRFGTATLHGLVSCLAKRL